MGRTRHQRLEALRRDLEDQVVVYALTGRRPPERLVAAFVKAWQDVEAASGGGGTRAALRPRLFGRWLGLPAAA